MSKYLEVYLVAIILLYVASGCCDNPTGLAVTDVYNNLEKTNRHSIKSM